MIPVGDFEKLLKEYAQNCVFFAKTRDFDYKDKASALKKEILNRYSGMRDVIMENGIDE